MHRRTNFVNPEVITTQGTEKDRNGFKKGKAFLSNADYVVLMFRLKLCFYLSS